MIEFGTTGEQLGAIALACRNRANANPRAQMHERPLTMDDYLAARPIYHHKRESIDASWQAAQRSTTCAPS